MDPARRVVKIFSTDGVEGQTFSPHARLRSSIDAFDEAREYPRMSIGRTGSQKYRVWVPGYSSDRTADRLLDMLRDPPVVLFLEIADSNDSGTGSHGKLRLGRRPAHKSCSAVYSEEDESWLITGRRWFPNQGISIWELLARLEAWSWKWKWHTLGARHDSPAVQCNINTGDCLIVTLKLILKLESSASSSIEFNAGVSSNRQCLLICGEGMVCDRVVKEVVDFWSSHSDELFLIGGALYYQAVCWRINVWMWENEAGESTLTLVRSVAGLTRWKFLDLDQLFV